MLDITLEKEKKLSTQEIYDILDFSIQAANDNGFINSFIFVRAMYLYAAIRLYEDKREELQHKVAEDLLGTWDELLNDGTIEDMYDKFYVDMNLLADYGQVLMDEFTEYSNSARGLLTTIQDFSSDIIEQASKRFQQATSSENLQKISEIANSWGMNNLPQSS